MRVRQGRRGPPLTVSPDSPTEPLRKATRPLESAPAAVEPSWACARCRRPVEPLGQGHYGSACLAAMAQAAFHFCCPVPPGCELQEAS